MEEGGREANQRLIEFGAKREAGDAGRKIIYRAVECGNKSDVSERSESLWYRYFSMGIDDLGDTGRKGDGSRMVERKEKVGKGIGKAG